VDKNNVPTRIHLYNINDVLRPRGSMKKESLGETILERLQSVYESWTNPEFGDNPDIDDLYKAMEKNLHEEVDGAWKEFIIQVTAHKKN